MKKTLIIILSAMLLTATLSACGEDEYAETDGELVDIMQSETTESSETVSESETEETSLSETTASSVSDTTSVSDASDTSNSSDSSQTTTTAASTQAKKGNTNNNNNNNNVQYDNQYEQPSYNEDIPQNEPAPAPDTPAETNPPEIQTEPPVTTPAGSFVSDDMFIMCDNGYMFTVGGNMNDVIASIGEANFCEESPSCLGDGTDMVYTYDGFTINTFVNTSGENIIISVDLTGSATSKGISAGMTMDDIISAYGTDYQSSGQYISYYIGSDQYLEFTLDGSVITSISYYYDYVPQ